MLAMLMGTNISCLIIWITLLCSNVEASQNYTQSSLNSFLYDYAFRNVVPRPRTGRVYDVTNPLNFSGIEISVIRLRTHSLWKRGLNLSAFRIPPKFLPRPFANRVDLVYQNLGNWSKFYYNVPNHEFVAPVLGILAYDSNVGRGLIELNLSGPDPIIVRFRDLSVGGDGRMMKCVRFGADRAVEFTNLTLGGACVARGEGHFSVVVPRESHEGKRVILQWWVMGVIAVGLILVILIGILFVWKVMKWKNVKKMERESENGECLGTKWIGNSKMPCAEGIRTQSSLEDMIEF